MSFIKHHNQYTNTESHLSIHNTDGKLFAGQRPPQQPGTLRSDNNITNVTPTASSRPSSSRPSSSRPSSSRPSSSRPSSSRPSSSRPSSSRPSSSRPSSPSTNNIPTPSPPPRRRRWGRSVPHAALARFSTALPGAYPGGARSNPRAERAAKQREEQPQRPPQQPTPDLPRGPDVFVRHPAHPKVGGYHLYTCAAKGERSTPMVHQVAALEAARFLRMCEQDHPAAPLGRLGVFYRTGAGKTRIQSDILNDWFDDDKYRIGVVPDLKLVTNFYKQPMKDDRSLYVQAFRNYLYCWGAGRLRRGPGGGGVQDPLQVVDQRPRMAGWEFGRHLQGYPVQRLRHAHRPGPPNPGEQGAAGGRLARGARRHHSLQQGHPPAGAVAVRDHAESRRLVAGGAWPGCGEANGRPFRMYYIKQVNEYFECERTIQHSPKKSWGRGGGCRTSGCL